MDIIKFKSAELMMARALTAQSQKYNSIRDNINRAIEKASYEGRVSYTYGVSPDSTKLPSQIVEELIDAGYRVDEENRVISWGPLLEDLINQLDV